MRPLLWRLLVWLRVLVRRFALWLLWLTEEDEAPQEQKTIAYGPVCGCGRPMPVDSLKMHDGVYRCFKCKRTYKE